MTKSKEKIEKLTQAQLQTLYKDFVSLPYHIAENGPKKGHEVIDVSFRQWRKGTKRNTIFEWFHDQNIAEWDVKNG